MRVYEGRLLKIIMGSTYKLYRKHEWFTKSQKSGTRN